MKNENYFTIQLIFAAIHGLHCTFWYYSWPHCTILANFYLYLHYFQQNVFSFSKIKQYLNRP